MSVGLALRDKWERVVSSKGNNAFNGSRRVVGRNGFARMQICGCRVLFGSWCLVRRWNGRVKSVAPYPAKIIRNNGKATRRRWKTDFQRVRSKREDVRWKRYSRHRERVTLLLDFFLSRRLNRSAGIYDETNNANGKEEITVFAPVARSCLPTFLSFFNSSSNRKSKFD